MSNFLEKIRKDRGLTLQELADAVGTSNQQIHLLEKGKRRLTWEWLQKLSNALECHPMEITEGPAEESLALTDEEKRLLQTYRNMSDQEQKMYLNMGKAYTQEKIDPETENADINKNPPEQQKELK